MEPDVAETGNASWGVHVNSAGEKEKRDRPDKDESQRLRQGAWAAAALAATVIAYILPCYIAFFLVFVFLSALRAYAIPVKGVRWTLIIAGVLMLNRAAGAVFMMWDSRTDAQHYSESPRFIIRYFPISLGALADGEFAENAARFRFVKVAGSRSLTDDPFTAQPLKRKNGFAYSVGPDLKDQGLSAIYDPTNGTFSEGDIPLGAWVRPRGS